jgi:aminocarboxymuconate-semialdehyde decarboxylase
MKRREFLKTSGSVAGLTFVSCGLGSTGMCAQESLGRERRRIVINGRRMRTIDIHCHSYVHDVWPLIQDSEEIDYLMSVLDIPPLRNKIEIDNVDFRLQQMDEQGIDIQAVSLHVGQYHHWAGRELAAEIVRIQNQRIAELCAAHPDRFVGLGAVALQHPDLAVEQMQHAIKELDMRGFMITGSVNDKELSDPMFHPFWAAAEELAPVIFIHPRNFPSGQSRFGGNGELSNVIGNPLETSVALSHLIFDGTLDRFPGVKICAAHGGGYLPSYIGRSDHCVKNWPAVCKPVDKLPSEYLGQLYFDSLVYSTENLRHLISTVGADRIVIGTDFPFNMGNVDSVNHLLSVPGLTAEQQEAILGGTAASLLGID